MAWGAGARLEGLAHAEALAFIIIRVVQHDPERRRALRRPGREDPARPRATPVAHVLRISGHEERVRRVRDVELCVVACAKVNR